MSNVALHVNEGEAASFEKTSSREQTHEMFSGRTLPRDCVSRYELRNHPSHDRKLKARFSGHLTAEHTC